ncbi:PREDICTED: sodium channel protein Nach-like [Vollenhovia emeryi]|uniref:sodium channel protein Nach-like n=1 Tax=Vollenhovia emeryi TaxID=411798 RepID=UPI0005F4E917|nr:PREDICTED: sodium channel protein Nach-like [Vollenhovia emeryi]
MLNTLQHRQHTVKKITVNHIDVSKKNKELFDFPKLYNRSAVKTKRVIAQQLLQEYLYNSSVHGMKYFSKLQIKSSIIGKLFWTSIMICSFVFLTLMLQKFWTRYSTNPTRSIIRSFHIPIFRAPFPALTICPLIPPMSSRRRKVFESLRLPHGMSNATGRFLVRYGPAFANENAPGGKAHLKDLKSLLKLNNMSLIDLIIALRPCEDIFESCAWNDVNMNCSELFKVSYTFTGICCSFNYLLEDYIQNGSNTENLKNLLTTPLYGPNSGLTILLNRNFLVEDDPTEEKYVKYSTNSVGLVMFPHHPLEYVTTLATRQILQTEQELQISVTPFIKKKLEGYYEENSRGELVPNCADESTKLKYFPLYRYSNCFTSCSIEAVLQACSCVPYYYTPVAKKYSLKICDWTDVECLYKNSNDTRIIQNVVTENLTCECLTPCWNVVYDLRTSTLELNGDHDFNPPLYKNLSDAQSVLRIFMRSETFMEMDTIPVADELYLLSSLGGIFSLFLGCSFISVIEILYFLGLFLCSTYKKSK